VDTLKLVGRIEERIKKTNQILETISMEINTEFG
jgi:hypothetical protein